MHQVKQETNQEVREEIILPNLKAKQNSYTTLIEVGKEARIEFAFRGMEINLKNEKEIESKVLYLFFVNICSISFERTAKIFKISMSNGDKYQLTNFESKHFNKFLEKTINYL
jgi:hypothetical protein